MTLLAFYLHAARAKRAYELAIVRMETLDKRRGRRKEHKRALRVSMRRMHLFETARFEARDRMLFDPYEERAKHEIALRFAEISAARRKGMS